MNTKRVVRIALIAALYAVFTIVLAPISYGFIQFRVSEMLKVFVLFDPFLSLGIGIGTFFANLASPQVGGYELIFMPITDIVGGLFAYFIYHALKRHYPVVPMAIYAITTGIAVGFMLYSLGFGSLWLLMLPVIGSELVILPVGIPIIFFIEKMLRSRNVYLS
jgi:uncharacterized membrane protein